MQSYKYRIKGILFSMLSLSGPSSGEPDRVSQMMGPDKDSIENKMPFILYIFDKSDVKLHCSFFSPSTKLCTATFISSSTITYCDVLFVVNYCVLPRRFLYCDFVLKNRNISILHIIGPSNRQILSVP